MHPDLCRYTSEVFYDDRLGGVDGPRAPAGQRTPPGMPGTGLVFSRWPQGNANSSPEEAAEVVRLVRELIGSTWTDDKGQSGR